MPSAVAITLSPRSQVRSDRKVMKLVSTAQLQRMANQAGRRATVVLVRSDGEVLGQLRPIELSVPWWPDTADLLAALRERFGLNAVVLRLLAASTPRLQPGADVTYAVELVGTLPPSLPLEPCDGIALGEDPLRMPWARPGGVHADVAWADRELANLGYRRTGPAEQIKSWNLSLLLRMPTNAGRVWLKHVPPFMRHEPAVISLVREIGAVVPVPLAADAFGRMLLEDVPGEDTYQPDETLTNRMVESFVALQQRAVARFDAVLATGCPNWSADAFLHDAIDLAARTAVRADLDMNERASLDRLIAELTRRFEALYESGMPETLVHGDFHPGNHRYDGHRLVLLDWGDSGVGHPLLDMTAFLKWVPSDRLGRVTELWITRWKDVYGSANVSRAVELIRPLGAMRQALVYRKFLDGIEASEQVYHREDPAFWLRRAIALS
jgi:aminoglycoside phosphotransferase (APT) family kinase protein